ncbi:ribonuclease P protein component [Mycoplasmopsis felis]|uniref:ribonuclease P protein component n=1 Tax=Mycoplasmopsis felis TaxID=33923 RepID=UPI002AFF4329|nr:ribonuclease P protein component [Mycoplasmopsis felis]WQQ04917.1 ribonuclease P protein component [Mycoplasmopsis felis]
MKKEYRLKKNWDFQNVIKQNNFLQNKYLVIYFVKSEKLRIGITVPKKFENSVGRNFNKRQLKAIIREINIFDLSYDFVLIIRKEFCNTSFKIKKEGIKKLFEKFINNEKNKQL